MSKIGRIPWVSLSVGVLALLIHAGGPACFELFVWRADWPANGAFWRIASGHLVHVDGGHLLWDLSAFLLLGCYLERRDRRGLVWTLALSVLLAEAFLRASGRFELYCGLSGVAMGLFVAVGWRFVGRGRLSSDPWLVGMGAAALAAAVGKLAWELLASEAVFVGTLADGYRVAVEAHAAGLLAATLSGWRWRWVGAPRSAVG